MATTLGIQYYNSFWLKKKDFSDPTNFAKSWYIEESRIKGGFNDVAVGNGSRAYTTLKDDSQRILPSSIIYSGIYNSRTTVNQTNVFSVAEDITKAVDPDYGGIQKLYSEDTNLTVFQESKVHRALIDKDAVYTAEGNAVTTTSNVVIGQIQSYAGEYGISQNPESFAVYGYRKYFADKDRSAILRLSQDGITEISSYGMKDWFRDALGQNGSNDLIVGGWDIHNKNYTVSIQNLTNSYTLVYDELVQGWVSFHGYVPEFIFSLKSKFFSTGGSGTNAGLYQHYADSTSRGSYYGTSIQKSSITFIFNPGPSTQKVFKTIAYEGSNGWEMANAFSGSQGVQTIIPGQSNATSFADRAKKVLSYLEGSYDSAPTPNTGASASQYPIYHAGFDIKENKYVAPLQKSFSTTSTPGQVLVNLNPAFAQPTLGLKGYFITVTMSTDAATDAGGEKELFAVSSEYNPINGY
jgi:hypothetical protein